MEDKENKKLLGKRIKYIRENMGLTMEEFIEKIDGSSGKGRSGTVNNWESGQNLPNKKRLKRIAEMGGVDIGFLQGNSLTENDKQGLISNRLLSIFNQKYSNNFRTKTDGEKKIVAALMENFEYLINLPFKQVEHEEEFVNIIKGPDGPDIADRKTVDDIKSQLKESEKQRDKYVTNWSNLLSHMFAISEQHEKGSFLRSETNNLKELNAILDRLNKE